MKKLLFVLAAVIIGIPLLFVVAVAVFIDPIVRLGVERGSAAALKVPTRLNSASVRFSGHLALGGFHISNPPGFHEPESISFEKIAAALRPRELLKCPVTVDEVMVEKPVLTLEFTGTKTNWSALMDNLSQGQETTPKPKGGPEATPEKTFIVRTIRIRGAVAKFCSTLIPGGSQAVTLPPLELKNVGTAEGGESAGEILATLLGALGSSAVNAGEGILPTELLQNLQSEVLDKVKGLKQLPTQTLDVLREKAEGLKKQIPDAKKDEERVRDLFEKKP